MRSSPGAVIRFGQYAVVDNRHGLSKLVENEFYDQAVFLDEDTPRLGWWWNCGLLEDQPMRGPIGAPKVMTGWNPYSVKERAGTMLPARIAEIDRLLLAYRVDRIAVDGAANLSADVWIQPDPERQGEAAISGEMMVWFGSFGFEPGEAFHEIGDFRFGLFSGKILRSGGTKHPFPTWIFLLGTLVPTTQAIFPLHLCVQRLMLAGEVDPEHWVSSVQLMTEVVRGHGICTVDRFDVRLERTRG